MTSTNVTKTNRTWCFTWNNYTEDAEMRLQCSQNWTLLCYGREIAPSGTRHLQGVIILKDPQRMSFLKKEFGQVPHWEICENLHASINYCKKDKNFYFKDKRKKRGPKTGDPTPIPNRQPNEDLIREIILSVTKIAGQKR